MRRVPQLDPDGCGIACVAMLTGEEYKTIRKKMFPDGNVKRTETRDLKPVLEFYGCKVAVKLVPIKPPSKYKDLDFDAILRVERKKSDPKGGHWIIWDSTRQMILDPCREKPGRYRSVPYPVQYLRVVRPEI